jgi:hypothetical protein
LTQNIPRPKPQVSNAWTLSDNMRHLQVGYTGRMILPMAGLPRARINLAGLLAVHELRNAWAQFPTSNGCGPSLAPYLDCDLVTWASFVSHGPCMAMLGWAWLGRFWSNFDFNRHWNALVLPVLLRRNLPTVVESYVLGGHCAKMWRELRRSGNSWALRKVEDEVRKELRDPRQHRNSYGQNLSFTPVV